MAQDDNAGGAMRLLLVEDDEMIAETVLESMRREGCR